jgi:hypothetical protein
MSIRRKMLATVTTLTLGCVSEAATLSATAARRAAAHQPPRDRRRRPLLWEEAPAEYASIILDSITGNRS